MKRIIFVVILISGMLLALISVKFEDSDKFLKPIRRSWNTVIAVFRSISESNKNALPKDFFSLYVHKVSEIDGMILLFVPSGEFMMGKSVGNGFDYSPEHKVVLKDFWIDALEVTNEQYRLCVESNYCSSPDEINWMYDLSLFKHYPVVYVSWYQAEEYCHWAGRTLPTEAEWEKASRGTQSSFYPWGNERPNSDLANFGNGIGMPVASGTYPNGASIFGAINMTGNVREWVLDWYNPTYYLRSPQSDPQGSPQGLARSLRGGGFNDPIDRLMAFNRFSHEPESPGYNRGFRCSTH